MNSKKIFHYSFFMILLAAEITFLVSCSGPDKGSDHNSDDLSNTAKSIACSFEETDNGFYLVPAYDSEYLYYYDDNARSAVKVCGKANCVHDSGDCDARFGNAMFSSISAYTLQSYHGKIYLWNSSHTDGPHLYSADSDGKNHKDLGALKIDNARGQGGVEASFISDNTAYVIAVAGISSLGYQYHRVYKRSIEAGAEAQLIFADEDEQSVEHRINQLRVDDGLVYFQDIAFYDGLDRLESRLYRYDPVKDELRNILTLTDKQIYYTVKDGMIYYSAFNYAEQSYEEICCYDPENDESTSFCSAGGLITWDGKNFVIEEFVNEEELMPSAVTFVSPDGEKVCEIAFSQLTYDPSFSGISMSESYVVTNTFDDSDNEIIRIFKKEDLLKGDLHFSELRYKMSYAN